MKEEACAALRWPALTPQGDAASSAMLLPPAAVLSGGVRMPILGFGLYQVPPREAERCAAEALEAGYHLIDTAQCYGNEAAVGRALEKSGLPRGEVFVTTKTWTNGYAETLDGIERSLEALRMDHVDLLLMHVPTADAAGTYRALEEAKLAGKARAIGVSNFYPRDLEPLLVRCRIAPAVDQIETHVRWQQRRMHAWLEARGILHQSWSPFGEGIGGIFRHPTLEAVGRAHGKTPAQVILRFLLEHRIAVIPKTVRRERMAENLNVFDFALSPEESATIEALDEDRSLFNWP